MHSSLNDDVGLCMAVKGPETRSSYSSTKSVQQSEYFDTNV